VRGLGLANYARRAAWKAKIAFIRERFRATGRPVPGVNAVIKWLLSRERKVA
jgi:hypothetical protein